MSTGKRANGEGTVRRNEARNRWEGRLTVGHDRNGKPQRRMVTGKTQAEVLRSMRKLAGDTESGITPARRDLTVGRYLESWLPRLRGTVAPATEQNYRDVVNAYITPHLGRKRLTTLSPGDVSKMLAELDAAGLSTNTQRLARSILRRALRQAEKDGVITRNPAALADGVKVRAQEGRTLTPLQARKLLTAVDDDRNATAVAVALSLGLRVGELLALAWDDVDLDAGLLTVRGSLKRLKGRGLVVENTKTRQSRRTVHLPKPCVDALRAHRVAQSTERLAASYWESLPCGRDLVFRTPIGTAVDPRNFRRALADLTTAAGLGSWHPHELRHSAASLLLAQGVPLEVVSETLGHSSIRITADVYAHLLEPARAHAADAMTEALWGN